MFFGEYKLSHPLGKGGMAQVFLARRRWDDGKTKAVVIKIPRAEAIASERASSMFLEEGRLAMMLDHENIVSVFDAGTHEGVPYIVMEYVAGKNLYAILSTLRRGRTKISIAAAAHIVRGLLYALRYLHDDFKVGGIPQKVVHRDVSAKNVILSGSGAVMLIDFGIASALGEGTSSIKGTFRYMAPEQTLAQASPASDIFGAGTVLWELLEGKSFRGHLGDKELPAAVARGVVPAITRKGVPKELRDLLRRLLHPEPMSRCSAAQALVTLEAQQFPSVQSEVRDLVLKVAGKEASRSGHTKHDGFEIPAELHKALAVARATDTVDSPGTREPDAPQNFRKRSPTTEDAPIPDAFVDGGVPIAPEAPDDMRAAPGQPTGPMVGPPASEPFDEAPSSASETAPVPTRVIGKEIPPSSTLETRDAPTRQRDSAPNSMSETTPSTRVATGNEGVERIPTAAWTRWIDQPETTDSAPAITERVPGPSPEALVPEPDAPAVDGYREVSPSPSPSPPPSVGPLLPTPAPSAPPAVARETYPTDPLARSVDTSPNVDEPPSPASFAGRLPLARRLLVIPFIVIVVFVAGLYATLHVLEPSPNSADDREPVPIEEPVAPEKTAARVSSPPPVAEEAELQAEVGQVEPAAAEPLQPEAATPEASPATAPQTTSARASTAAVARQAEDPAQPAPHGHPSASPGRPTTSPKTRRARAQPRRPTAPLALRLGFVERADVKIGRKTYALAPGKTIKIQIPVGKTRIRWRFEQGEKWSARTYDFVAAQRHVLLFESNGPRRSSKAL